MSDAAPTIGQDAVRPTHAPALDVHAITTGHVRPKARTSGPRRYLPGGWSSSVLPVHAFLVEHPGGLCLFDTGQTAAAAAPGHLPRWHPYLRLARFELTADDEAPRQIARMGYDPADVRWVVLSHLHTDHAGTVAAFGHAEVVVSAREWADATGLAGRLRGYLPQHWPAGLHPRQVAFSGPALGPFPASHDLAGDGRLVLVPTPGHTPGHLSMLVRGEPSFLCAGDLAHEPEAIQATAADVADYCRAENITILTSHDAGAADAAKGTT